MSDELDFAPFVLPAEIEVRDLAKREIDMRLLPWDSEINTVDGLEEFRRGAFAGTDAGRVFMYGPEHEVRMGIAQGGALRPIRVPAGKGTAFREDDDGPHLTVRAARTPAGDEALALAADGIVTGVSAEFAPVPGGTTVQMVNKRRKRIHTRVALSGVSLTTTPAYGELAAVTAVRSQSEGVAQMGEAQEATPVAAPAPVIPALDITPLQNQLAQLTDQLAERIEKLETRSARDIEIPKPESDRPDFTQGDWMKLVLRMMTGEKVSQREIDVRTAADLITTDNLGVVPDAYLQDLVNGDIDPSRPFLESTTKLNLPPAGMSLVVPVLTTKPTVGVQANEKDELTSTATAIDTDSFDAVTVGGYGDISLQLLKRSDPSFLDLYVKLLAEQYAIKADDLAIDALLAASINSGGTLDPEAADFGDAWANGAAVGRRFTPDTIWLSSTAVGRFIDAKASGTNSPLYSNIAANFTAGGGPGGTISGLRPVHVPALDDEAVDVIVGPRRGFAWTEDGTYTLQVDVPAKAGRDVALVGMLWFAPLYPDAFTSFAL